MSTALVQTFNDMGGKGRRLGRRLSEEQAERSIHEHFGQTSRDVLETKKVRGLVLRDRIRQDKTNMKQHNSRCHLSAHYWKELVREFSQDVETLTRLGPSDLKEIVSETLLRFFNTFDGNVADVLAALRRIK